MPWARRTGVVSKVMGAVLKPVVQKEHGHLLRAGGWHDVRQVQGREARHVEDVERPSLSAEPWRRDAPRETKLCERCE